MVAIAPGLNCGRTVTVHVPSELVNVVLHAPSLACRWNIVVWVSAPGVYDAELEELMVVHVLPPLVEYCHW